jgi:hypothetical protein
VCAVLVIAAALPSLPNNFIDMRLLILSFIISIATLSLSQTRNIRINIYKLDISREDIHVDLNSQAENLNLCRIEILDSLKNAVKMEDFPKATSKPGIKQWTAKTFPISDLTPGKYTLILFIGKEEFYRRSFRKDKK